MIRQRGDDAVRVGFCLHAALGYDECANRGYL